MARGRRESTGGRNPNYERVAQQAIAAFLKLDRRAQIIVGALVLVIAAGVLVYKWRHTLGPPPVVVTADARAQMLLGNPSGATADGSDRSNYLMTKPYFAVAYDDEAGTPRWVSWRVTRADLAGDAPRKQVFDPDASLPPGFYRVTHGAYSSSGFDRGHLCPHGDRSATQDTSWATFVMTNIIPQAPAVNQGAWANLEDYCRGLVREGNRLYITAGPVGQGGVGTNGPAEKIDRGRVTVPAACWKIAVVVPEAGGEDDLAKIGSGTRVITVLMPNDNVAIAEAWAGYRTSVGEVARRTGYRFFDRLSPGIVETLSRQVDDEPVKATPARHRAGSGTASEGWN